MNVVIRYAAIYGLIAGAIVIAIIALGLNFSNSNHLLGSMWFGYLVMLVALTLIFVGVKRYRDIERGGVIRFLPAFGLGLAIAVMAGVAYVALWETYCAVTNYNFIDDYIASVVRARQAAGVSAAALAPEVAELETLRVQYANPLFRLPMTFLEIFPVGLVVALVSALLLRNPRMFPARVSR